MEQRLKATLVTSVDELKQIEQLSLANNTAQLSPADKTSEGFVTWSYHLDDLQQLHQITPSIIVKEGDLVAGYALVLTREGAAVYPPLQKMLTDLAMLPYNGKPLDQHNYYVMGQVCVHPSYRGKGVFQLLYGKHKELFEHAYDMLVTEISVANQRSQRAHEKTGFRTIHTYRDELGEWNVVVWDWRSGN